MTEDTFLVEMITDGYVSVKASELRNLIKKKRKLELEVSDLKNSLIRAKQASEWFKTMATALQFKLESLRCSNIRVNLSKEI